MKYCLVFIIIFYAVNFNSTSFAGKSEESNNPVIYSYQQEPFYFLSNIPPAIKIPGKIDLSFFKNRLVVFMYRYRLQIPNAVETAIDRSLVVWSAWTKDDFTPIIIPRLDLEGGHKLIIEYKEIDSDETKNFEMPFYVYRINLSAYSSDSKPAEQATIERTTERGVTVTEPERLAREPDAVTGRTEPEPNQEASRASTKQPPVAEETIEDRSPPVIDKLTFNPASINILPDSSGDQTEALHNLETDSEYQLINEDNQGKNALEVRNKIAEPSEIPPVDGSIIEPDYNKLLAEAIEKNDAELFRLSILSGAGSEIKGPDGGNIFHLINNTVADEELISTIKNNGIGINEPDDYGNSPLHVAILSGKSEYARFLINQGAELNSKNNLELTPLHLAVILNDKKVANSLMIKGADINMKGNTGYTPLHIASEMNNISLAKDLLYMGAKNNIKTDQKLTPGDMAKIQKNYEMNKLIGKHGSYALDLSNQDGTKRTLLINNPELIPKYDFLLPYDNELAKKRQFNKVVLKISVPVAVLSTSLILYMKNEADEYYSLSKIAETEALAKIYYDKTKRYDTYTYISGGISIISVYGFINSVIRKRSITRKMYKTFN